MRRIAALASLATLLVVLLPGAAAGGTGHEDRHGTVVFVECETTTDDGYVFLFVVSSSRPDEDFADLTFWANGLEPFVDQPTLFVGDATAAAMRPICPPTSTC